MRTGKQREREKGTYMKREFLESLDLGGGAKLPREAVEAIMAEHGKAKQALEGQIGTLARERDEWKGRAENAESITSRLPEGFDPDEYAARQAAGQARFTVSMAGGGDGRMSRDEIMAIRDRGLRRAAIAQNLDLFEKES